MELGDGTARRRAVRSVRCARLGVTAALLVAVAAGCSAGDDASERAARAAAAVTSWKDPAVQQRWSTALVGHTPLVDMSSDLPVSKVLASLSQGLVNTSPSIGDERSTAVVDYVSASDQKVLTFGARSTLRALAVGPPTDTCWNAQPCEEVLVTSAKLTTMAAPTARGTASVPAWAYTVNGLPEPLVLPAVAITSTSEVNPDHPGVSPSKLVRRDGTTLRVLLFVPYCGGTPSKRHLIETDAVVVVWASAKPNHDECAAPVLRPETFTLRAPIGDRPIVDEAGSLLLPEQFSPATRP